MEKLIVVLVLLCTAGGHSQNSAIKDVTTPLTIDTSFEDIKNRCYPPDGNEEPLYYDDVSYDTFTPCTGNHWSANRTVMAENFWEIYAGKKRLLNRAFYHPVLKEFVIPLEAIDCSPDSPYAYDNRCYVKVPESHIKSLIFHIEEALRRYLAEYVFFPDMGHNHYFVPQSLWDEKFSKIKHRGELLTQLLAEPALKILYHTAEKLMTKGVEGPLDPLPYRRFRYQTRNIVGDNMELGILEIFFNYDSNYNTIGEYKNFWSYSAGMNLSANHNGCFPYRVKGKTFYFDIAFADLRPGPKGRSDCTL